MSEKSKDRVYVVEVEGLQPRLVRATYGHMAERYVIGHLVTSRVASKDDLIDLMSKGVRCEDAADDPKQQPLQLPEPVPHQAQQPGWETRAEELEGFANTGA